MTTQHTPGFFVEKNDPLLCMRGTENLFSVCRKYEKNGDSVTEIIAENIEQREAQLFAAAPDMLDALQDCLDFLLLDSMMEEDAAPEIEKIRAALRKAKGGE